MGTEAYGAAYTLQEMLTVKSDDVLVVQKCIKTLLMVIIAWSRVCRNPSTCSLKKFDRSVLIG